MEGTSGDTQEAISHSIDRMETKMKRLKVDTERLK